MDKLTVDTVTIEQLLGLHEEAVAANDTLTMVLVERAIERQPGHDNFADLTEDQQRFVLSLTIGQALARCVKIINDARTQEDS